MTQQPFSPDEIGSLSGEMDTQLEALHNAAAESAIRWIKHDDSKFPEPQAKQVENALVKAGEDPDAFWLGLKRPPARMSVWKAGLSTPSGKNGGICPTRRCSKN